jgi:hypothetical protein
MNAFSAMPPRTIALGAANLVVAALAIWPWLPHGTPSAARPAASAVADAPTLPTLPPFSAFAAISERPLFSPSRRAPAAEARGTSALEGRYRLLGLVITGNTRRALIGEVAGGRRFDVGEGEAIDGWSVKRIARDAVVFDSPAGEATLTLQNAAPTTKP